MDRGVLFFIGEKSLRWKGRICGKVEERRKGTHHEHSLGVHLASFNPPSQRQEEGYYNLAAKRATRVGEVQNDRGIVRAQMQPRPASLSVLTCHCVAALQSCS